MYQHREKIWHFYHELKKEYDTNIILITFSERTQWHTNIKEIAFTGKKSSAAVLNSLLSPTTPAIVVSDFIFQRRRLSSFKKYFLF